MKATHALDLGSTAYRVPTAQWPSEVALAAPASNCKHLKSEALAPELNLKSLLLELSHHNENGVVRLLCVPVHSATEMGETGLAALALIVFLHPARKVGTSRELRLRESTDIKLNRKGT